MDTIRGYLKAAAESLGMTFYYGSEGDDFLRKLESGVDLVTDGHFLLADLNSTMTHSVDGWENIPCKAVLQMQTERTAPLNDADVVATSGVDSVSRLDHRTDMYNAWIYVIDYFDTNYSATAQIVPEWEYKFFSFGDNVTEGVSVEFTVHINAYDC